MNYVRTKQNNYGIDIVIDITTNENFVKTSGLEWIKVTTGSPAIGDYYYNDQFINTDSSNYTIIRDLIFNKEEPNRILREKEEAERLAQSPATLDSPEPLEFTPQIINPVDLPRPVASASLYENIEMTQAQHDNWTKTNANLKVLIDALENKNPTVDNTTKTVTFNTPIEFPDGVSQDKFTYHVDEQFSDYVQYLKDTDTLQNNLLIKLKTSLGISTT